MTGVLGVDGGQSGIRLRHSSGGGIVEVEGVSRLEGDTVAMVADAVARGWRQGAFEPVERVILGLTTAPVDPAACDRLCGLVGAATGAPEVWLADDAVTSHAGALSMGPGVSLVAGTGVACLAVPRFGEPRIIGGHGFLLGDEGGAFWIGREALRAVLRAGDGRDGPTALTAAAEPRFGTLADLHVRLHEADRPVDAIAHFAPDVMAVAEGGDAVAGAILDAAAQELVLVALVGARWAADAGSPVPLALGGRLLQAGTVLRQRIEAVLGREGIPVDPRSASGTALDGAVAIGLSGEVGAYRGLIHAWHDGGARA